MRSVLTPTGIWCEEAWITTAAQTSTLAFIVALRPDSLAPTLAVQMAATFQRQSGGWLVLNIVTGSDEQEQRRYGRRLGHDRRYERIEAPRVQTMATALTARSGMP
ncbi:LLM class flavin-dependent oxidoreductase [Catenulispora acidiphila]|uniref:LLM class flavin-dependent oxidoreductase n=1 Tax=Catenulispora acidiphila TaxID=304895 RepID=UPI0002F33CD4|nr:LLM class flavin-dependent oxidoreductase [Catenulispora acidiphila]